MAKKKADGVYYLTLYKFGYDLVSVGRTREECLDAMREEYIKTYAKWNKLDEQELRAALVSPILDEDGEVDEYDVRNEFVEYYHNTFDDEEPYFFEFGKVEWT